MLLDKARGFGVEVKAPTALLMHLHIEKGMLIRKQICYYHDLYVSVPVIVTMWCSLVQQL